MFKSLKIKPFNPRAVPWPPAVAGLDRPADGQNSKLRIRTLGVIFLLMTVFFLINVSGQPVQAAFNEQINYQGKLTDANNLAVADGEWRMYFRFYTTAVGGSNIWEEDRSTVAGNRITVTNGLFSAMLGSSTPLTGVDFNQTLYLGVEICGLGSGAENCDGEMTPRKILGAVPAAFESKRLEGLNSSQFLRSDAVNATTTSSTFLTITQNGAGNIAEFIGPSASPVLTLLSGGNVGIGTTTPYAKLSVVGETVSTYFTATSTNSYSVFPLLKATGPSISGTAGGNALDVLTVTGGAGGNKAAGGTAGVGSSGSMIAGAGGAGTSGNASGGAGGSLTFTSGAGGAASGFGSAGAGGVITVTGGRGGAGAGSLSGNGGDLRLIGGDGGDGTNAGSGGNIYLHGGLAGIGDGGLDGNVYLGITSGQVAVGKVGVATVSPGSTLSVSGNASFGSYAANAAPTNGIIVSGFVGVGTTSPWARFSVNPASDDTGPMFAVGSSTETHFVIRDQNGNVGLGTSTPTYSLGLAKANSTLFINGATPGSQGLGFHTAGFNYDNAVLRIAAAGNENNRTLYITPGEITMANGDDLRFKTSKANSAIYFHTATGGEFDPRLTLTNAGVGIGTIVPPGNLGIRDLSNPKIVIHNRSVTNGDFGAVYFKTITTESSYLGNAALVFEAVGDTTRGKVHILNRNSNNSSASAAISDSRFTVLSTGEIGVASTTPWRTLAVTGTVGFSSALTQDAPGFFLCINPATYEVTNGSGDACDASSLRFKENIQPLNYGLNEILSLNPVSFAFRPPYGDSQRRRLGLIAEEVETVLPELIAYDRQGLASGLDYSKLTAVLVNAVKEIVSRLDEFGARLSALERRPDGGTNGGEFSESRLLSILERLGVRLANGAAHLRDVFAEKITVGSPERPTGVTLYDEITGEPYCLSVRNGAVQSRPGRCGENSGNPNPSPPVEETAAVEAETAEIDPPPEETDEPPDPGHNIGDED